MISAELLVHAYRSSVFPMALEDGEIGWFSPDPRAIIPIQDFHVPHGLKRTLKKQVFEVRINTAFERVMRACARRDQTWISEEIVASFFNLHRLGWAHSVEAWMGDHLAGGLYGVAIGGAFFGESMFHEVTDASKVALHGLIERLHRNGFGLLDTQWSTPHLKTFGTVEIPRSRYRRMLEASIDLDRNFTA